MEESAQFIDLTGSFFYREKLKFGHKYVVSRKGKSEMSGGEKFMYCVNASLLIVLNTVFFIY